MLDAVVRASGLNTLLDAVLSIEAVGVYKPHPKVYQLAVDRLGIPAAAIAFQSSNAWDAYDEPDADQRVDAQAQESESRRYCTPLGSMP